VGEQQVDEIEEIDEVIEKQVETEEPVSIETGSSKSPPSCNSAA
jgi:hypothetical protein